MYKSLAGSKFPGAVDCIDCAADSAVVTAVMEGVSTACSLALELHPAASIVIQKPWIMVSINDDEDPHFRKAGGCERLL